MKNLSLLLLTMVTMNALKANDEISFSTGFIIINKARVQSIQVDVPAIQDFDTSFLKWMNEEYDYGLDGGKIIQKNNNLYSVLGSQFPDISDKPIDLFIQINKSSNGVRLSFYTSFEFDSWMNWEQHPLEFTRFMGTVRKFIHNYLITLQPQ